MFGQETEKLSNFPINRFKNSYFSSAMAEIGMPNAIPKLGLEYITWAEAKYLAEMADRLMMDTPEGAEYRLKRIFSAHDAKYKVHGPPPGTVRVFSRRHISYFTGKSWKKISLPT
jgi:hypothetical protein